MKEEPFDLVRILDDEGCVDDSLPESLDEDRLIDLYYSMMLTRLFDQKAIALQRTGKLGTYASSYGQEAIGAALGMLMKNEDILLPSYREHAAQLQRGVAMEEIFLYWGGDERGSNFSAVKEDFPVAIPIASQCCHAVGVAYAFKYRKQPRVAVSVCGDGATSKGDFYESLNISGVFSLPVIFLVNNNQWAISVPRTAQSAATTIAHKGFAAGIESLRVDGNDVIALYSVLEKALEESRKGAGPRLIEAVTYRLCDHTTADDASRYRQTKEVEAAEKLEPVSRLRKYLDARKLWDDAADRQLVESCEARVSEATERYLGIENQSPTSLFDHLYEILPHSLKWQRDQLTREDTENG